MFRLKHDTPAEWVALVNEDVTPFLQNHAHAERKVATSALMLATHNPLEPAIVSAMIELAREEIGHFGAVAKLLEARGETIGWDRPDPYMGPLKRALRKVDTGEYLLDRLLLFAIVEGRGCERFELLARGLEDEALRTFYRGFVQAEARHHALFLRLARERFGHDAVEARLGELLDLEAKVLSELPLRPALH